MRLLALGALLESAVSVTCVHLFLWSSRSRVAEAGALSGQVPAPPVGGPLHSDAPGLLWPAWAVPAQAVGSVVLPTGT